MEGLYQQYKDQGFIVITLLAQTNSQQTPTQADLQLWADTYSLNHPVVADPNFGVTGRFIDGNTIALPSMTLLSAGAQVVSRDSWVTGSQVAANLPN
ncbi:MAG: hypothetical protein KC912_19500 [Proteobacteria bacterium]|nr:hypothetical protein [Pseudomonadota bacterium]